MIATILMYAVFTGLSGFAHSVWFYGMARFLTGMGVGGGICGGGGAGGGNISGTVADDGVGAAAGMLYRRWGT